MPQWYYLCRLKRLWHTVEFQLMWIRFCIMLVCVCTCLTQVTGQVFRPLKVKYLYPWLNELCSHKTSQVLWHFENGLLIDYNVYIHVKCLSWLQSVFKANCTAWFIFQAKCIITLKGKFFSHIIKRENYTGIIVRDKQTDWRSYNKKTALPREPLILQWL